MAKAGNKESVVLDTEKDADTGAPKFESVDLSVTGEPVSEAAQHIADEHKAQSEADAQAQAKAEHKGEVEEKVGEAALEKKEESLKKKIKIKLGRLGKTYADVVQWCYDQYHLEDDSTLNDLLTDEELDEEHKNLEGAMTELIDNRLEVYSQYGDLINVGGETLISFGTRVARATKHKNRGKFNKGAKGAEFGGKEGFNSTQTGDLSLSADEARKLMGR